MTPHKPFGELSDAEKGALLLAHHEGKRIEARPQGRACCEWAPATNPAWYPEGIYRIAPEPKVPDSINWEHVAPEYNFMARDADGFAMLWKMKPEIICGGWSQYGKGIQYVVSVEYFASYRRGTVEWQDSLVIRPGYEGS